MKKTKQKNGVVKNVTAGLESALLLSQAFERLLVDVVAAFVPWLAPIIPAYLAFHSLYNVLIPGVLWVSIVGAAVVEFLGLATVTTVVQFNEFNSTRKDGDPSAPFWPAALTAAFYLAVVLTVNVLLDNSELIDKVAKGLMSSLSVAGAVTISLRGQHRRRVDAKTVRDTKADEERKAKEKDDREYKRKVSDERRKNKQELKKLELQVAEKKAEEPKVSEKVSENDDEKPETFGKWQTWRKVPLEERVKIARMTDVQEVMRLYGTSDRTGYNWMRDAHEDPAVIAALNNWHHDDGIGG